VTLLTRNAGNDLLGRLSLEEGELLDGVAVAAEERPVGELVEQGVDGSHLLTSGLLESDGQLGRCEG